MKKLKLISGVSATLLSCVFGNFVAKAGPVRPTIKSVVFKMVGGSQVKPYDLNSEQRKLWKTTGGSRISRSPSPSDINPNDGQLPSTSSSSLQISSFRRSLSLSSISSEESTNPSDINPNDGQSPSTSSLGLQISSFRRSLSLSSISSEEGSIIMGTSSSPSSKQITIIKSSGSSSTEILSEGASSSNVQQEILSSASTSTRTRRYAKPKDMLPGESVFLPTHDNDGRLVTGPSGGPRPHLVLKVQESRYKANHTEVTIVDMSRAKGKGYDFLNSPIFHLIDPDLNPAFSGNDRAFLKLNKVKTLQFPSEARKRMLGKVVTQKELDTIRGKLGIRD